MVNSRFSAIGRFALTVALGSSLIVAGPAASQTLRTVDPDTVIDGDLSNPQPAPATQAAPETQPAPAAEPAPERPTAAPGFWDGSTSSPPSASELPPTATATGGPIVGRSPPPANQNMTYGLDELLPAAQGVFGKGARGLAEMIEDLLKKQGRPNGYIVGTEAGGAFLVGIRYGSGTLYHKIEGPREVHWTGPSLGADIGASGGRTFILVYNLYDTNDLFNRFVAGEGQAYLLGGFNISELKRDDIVLIPVRLGVGLRLGVNVGYMKFTKKKNILPF